MAATGTGSDEGTRPRGGGAARARFDLVALVASAGGLSALNQVLPHLPDDFGAPVVIVQHLGWANSILVDILRRRSSLPVEWIADHETLKPGRVLVCPPKRLLEVMPDGDCSLRPIDPHHMLRPIDSFLASVAESYGQGAMAVVLTGMGRDAALGARAVREAGGTVLAQSPDTAEHPGMPLAAIEAGAADLVLPLPEIGRVVTEIAGGGLTPRTMTDDGEILE